MSIEAEKKSKTPPFAEGAQNGAPGKRRPYEILIAQPKHRRVDAARADHSRPLKKRAGKHAAAAGKISAQAALHFVKGKKRRRTKTSNRMAWSGEERG